MFVVTEAEAAAIRAALEKGGELGAAEELRRHFPGIVDTVQARKWAQVIASWQPRPSKMNRMRPLPRSHPEDRG